MAGTGTSGFSGDGGPGRSAQLNSPYGVAVDSAGNVLIADYANNRIRRLQSNDFMQTIAGCGTTSATCIDVTEGRLAGTTAIFGPWDVAVDAAGNFYFPDSGQQRIRKVGNPGFILTNYAGTSAGFLGDGDLATRARLNNPLGVTLDASGNMYFSDLNNQRVRKIDASGVITTIAGTGTAGFLGDNGAGTSSRLNSPHGLAVDTAGNVYIADTNNYRIRKVTPAGIISTAAGNGNLPLGTNNGDNGLAVNASVMPWDVEVDALGNLYISDWLSNRIRKVDGATGIITTIAGNGTSGSSGDGGQATSATINGPTGMALDAQGNLYFADTGNHRIRKINAPPIGVPSIRTTNPVVPAFMGNAGFSSNMYVEIYGSNFSRFPRLWSGADFNGPNAPTSLNGVSVTVNGKPAFVYYVSPGQININVPEDSVTGSVAIQVRTAEGVSNTVTVARSRLSPTMLTAPAFRIGGKQYVIAQTPGQTFIGRPNMIAGVTFVSARAGDTVTIYALGLGPTSPLTQAGVAASQNSPVVLPLQVKIGDVEASVPFKGLLAGSIGLYQLNVVIPNVAAGDQKIELMVDGVKNEQDLTIVVGP